MIKSSININTSIKQKLSLNNQTKMWINIISIPAFELKEKIEKIIEENPFLEYDIDYKSKSSKDINSIIENTIQTEKESLLEYLKSQLRIKLNNKKDIEISEYIISFINNEGYLTTSIEEISETININIKKIEQLISIIKTLDPIGIASKNIEECLATQLKHKETKNDNEIEIKELAIKIVENYITELSKKNYEKLASVLSTTKEKILQALQLIQTLEPYPAREYDTSTVNYIIPELFIFKENNNWTVKTNESFIPNLKINKEYIKIFNRESIKDNNNKLDTLKEQKEEAINLISTIKQRKKSLLKVGEGLLNLQIDFFEKGKEHLKPLRLKDLSSFIDLSESTISRISNLKYLKTVWGTFSIKYFFSKSVGNGWSSTVVKERIKYIIQNAETKVSDEKIRLILKSEGIDIARRTVAKYRQSMNLTF